MPHGPQVEAEPMVEAFVGVVVDLCCYTGGLVDYYLIEGGHCVICFVWDVGTIR